MVYQVLARKWRPQVFEDVVGQEQVTHTLTNAIKMGRVAHAYLFSGPRGVGKTSVARILAKAMNCVEGEPGIPCNRCPSCTEISSGSAIDVQEIDGASNRGIDEIRELRENVRYMPSSSRFRVYIIDEVHMLTLPAFNALLKTLEEPPAHVKFIFATTEPHKVPVTILSRCQRFDFKRIPLGQVVAQLERITKEEGIEIGRSGVALIARKAEGSMRDAESLLDQVVSFSGPRVEDKDITDMLGIIDTTLLYETSLAIIEGSAKKCLEITDRIYNYGYDIREFYRALMDHFRNLLISLVAPSDALLDMTDTERVELNHRAERAGPERLQQSLNLLMARESNLGYASHPRLVLETVLIKLCQIGETLSFEDLIKKIENLERRLMTLSHTAGEPSPGRPVEGGSLPPVKERAGAETPGERLEGGEWEAFLHHLSSTNRAMASNLKDWRFLGIRQNTLEIAKGSSLFSSTYLDEQGRLEKFTEYCKEFFKQDIKVRIIHRGHNQKEAPAATESAKGNPATGMEYELPPPIQEVLDVFQGEIREEGPFGKKGVRDRGKREILRRNKE